MVLKISIPLSPQHHNNLYILSFFTSDLKMKLKRGRFDRGTFQSFFAARQGQVTIFIIVGIIILLVFGIILVYTSSSKTSLTAGGEPVIAAAPQEFASVQLYTEHCLSQVGEQGLRLLGEQGGYIYPETIGQFSATDPTEADGINLEPSKIPYWHYNSELNAGNKIVFRSLQPKLYAEDDSEMSIETQLARFVNERVDGCLNNYVSFVEQGLDIDASAAPDTEVHIADETVNFWLKKEVQAQRGDATHTFEQFYVKIPLRLKHYYEVASQIAEAERNYSFLERQGLDLIATFSGIDPAKLPPTEGVSFGPVPVTWSEADVHQKVKGMLVSYIPLLRYLGSTNFYRYDYPATPAAVSNLQNLYQKHYDNMILPLELGNDLQVNFDYFGWELYFDLNDQNGLIKPRSASVHEFILNMDTHNYYSTYDVSYPVLVTIRDPAALAGKGFNLVMALESNIRNNEVVRPDQILPPAVVGLQQSMVCDERKRTTEILRSVVVDSATGTPVEAVQVGFTIPEQTSCSMGVTDSQGEFASKYPAVYGGVGSYIKEGYLTSFYPIDTYNYKTERAIIGYAAANVEQPVIELHPFKAIKVRAEKKSLEKCIDNTCFTQGQFGFAGEPLFSYRPSQSEKVHSWWFLNSARKLSGQETATFILNRVSDTNPSLFNDKYSTTVTITGDQPVEVQLVPGKYQVTGLLTSRDKVVIPSEERCVNLLGGLVEECSTLDETVLENYLTGQVQWSLPEQYMTITPDQLYGSQEITLYLLSANLAGVPEKEHQRVLEDLQVFSQLGNFSGILHTNLNPSFN